LDHRSSSRADKGDRWRRYHQSTEWNGIEKKEKEEKEALTGEGKWTKRKGREKVAREDSSALNAADFPSYSIGDSHQRGGGKRKKGINEQKAAKKGFEITETFIGKRFLQVKNRGGKKRQVESKRGGP